MSDWEKLIDAAAVPADALNEAGYRLRYGMGPVEFQQRKLSGEVPGSVPNPGPEREDTEQRRAAAYFFAKQYPRLAPAVQRLVNELKASPQVFGSLGPPNPFADEPGQSGELARVATEASQRGSAEAQKDMSRAIRTAMVAAGYAPRAR